MRNQHARTVLVINFRTVVLKVVGIAPLGAIVRVKKANKIKGGR